jgi:DNA invertase Pin-like site-specific DNA recombinase
MEDVKQAKKRIYCATYTRKSTSEGLDQDFTSLDAQREAAESYINGQKHEGWVALQEKYDDGGFTGANLERPGLQKLLSDIKEHKIDCVIVYKVDRLSRSLMDFAHLLEFFDKNNVTFVSVTQAFNTNTSMGRLTLNILLSFAQFEREIISERTKDKMGAARKKGKWLGGRPLLGYDIDKKAKKLVVNKDEAKIIREIFDLYLQGNSLLKVAQALNNKGYRTKRTISENGRTFGGFKYGVTQIQSIITSVLYIGKVCYVGQIYEGEQKAIIDEETFKKAQEKLKENRVERKATKNIDCTGLLTHLLHCKTCKSFMFHTYTLKNATHKYRYYVCTSVQKHEYNSCPTKSVNAQAIEDATIDCLRKIFTDNKKNNDIPNKQEIEAFMSPIWDTIYPQEKRRILKALVKEIDYDSGGKKLGITLNGGNLRLEFDVDLKKVRPLNKWHKEIEINKEPKVRKMLILAYQIQQFVNEGRIKHPREACKWLNLSVTRMDQFMNTLFLCPAIQNEILSSGAPAINALTEFKIRPLLREVHWDKQLIQWQALVKNKK